MASSVVPNSTAQYIQFTARRQQLDEPVQAFQEALSALVGTIGIVEGAARNVLLMHQFVAGLADRSLQECILGLSNCTLTKAVDTATEHEAKQQTVAVLHIEGDGQDNPVNPRNLDHADNPVDPGNPDNADKPVDPGIPDHVGNPGSPDNPGSTDDPDDPGDPPDHDDSSDEAGGMDL